jgi:3',5'-cyclic AMP phosphodiesterase CpdA
MLGVSLSCSGNERPSSNPAAPSFFDSLLSAGGSAVLVGAGDIARCGSQGAELTATLLDRLSGTVFVAGDNAYMNGSAVEYRDCYHPTWGRHRGRTRPVPGNHEYQTPGAAGYYEYFGANAGPSGRGYYGYTVGRWFVLALNSEVPLQAGSPQLQWVSDQLAASPYRCTLVYWHRPLFSSGRNGPNHDMLDLWRVLYGADVDVVLNAHDHMYERFAPQTPEGQPDAARGIRQFTVGTGGAAPYDVVRLAANSEVTASVWGVASFTLRTDGYSWEFIPAEGFAFRDAGSGICH